jgi:hypothetical protein
MLPKIPQSTSIKLTNQHKLILSQSPKKRLPNIFIDL